MKPTPTIGLSEWERRMTIEALAKETLVESR